MSDYKKFEKNSPAYIANLYAEYCKTKKMADGGKVKNDESGNTIAGISTSTPEGHNLAVNYLGSRDRAINSHRGYDGPKSTGTGMGDVKFQDSLENPDVVNGYADGTPDVQPDDDSTLTQIGKAIKDAVEGPQPSPSPTPTPLDEKYQKIREQNRKNFDTPNAQPLAEGGEVDINPIAKSKQARQDAEISHNSTGTPASLLTICHQVNPTMGAVKLADSIPNYANGGVVQDNTVIADHGKPALGYKHAPVYKGGTSNPKISNVPNFDNGGQVQPQASPKPQEKTHQEKIVDILHRITDPNQDSINQRSIGNFFPDQPGYADGGKVEHVEGPEQDVDTQAVQRGMYIPDDQAQSDEENKAEQMAGDSAQGAVEEASQDQTPEQQAEQEASTSTTPDSATVVLDQPKKDDVRQLEGMTLDKDEAKSDDGQSAAEAAQPLLEKADLDTQSSILQQLKAAQQKQQAYLEAEQGSKIGALLAAGQAGHGAKPAPTQYLSTPGLAQAPIQNFMQKMALDKEDPNSAISKTYQDHIISGLGDKATPQQIANIRGSSASNLDKFLPQQTKLIYGQNQINSRKDMLNTRIDANKELNKNKEDFAAVQKDLDRKDRLKIAAMAQEGMKQRFDTPTLDRITNEVRNDPLLKPVILKKASVDESLNLLDEAKTIHPALLSDANFAFTQAMNLQPGATTQKRYDASKITEINHRTRAWVANNLNNPNADMREDDPDLFHLLHGYLSTVSDDYGHLIDQTQSTVLNTKKAAYNALGRPNIVNGITAMQGALGNAGRGPQSVPTTSTNTTPAPIDTVTVRRKSDGKTKTLAADAAAQYLKDPGYERVQ